MSNKNEQETLGDLECVGQLLSELVENEQMRIEMEVKGLKEYIIDDFIFIIVNNLLNNKNYENEVVKYYHGHIVEMSLLLLIKMDSLSIKASEIIRNILDVNQDYYKHNHNYNGNVDLLFGE